MDNWTPANQLPAFSFRPAPAPAAIQPGAPAAASASPAPATKVVAASPEVNNPDSTKPIGMDDLKGMIGKPEALEVDAEDAEKEQGLRHSRLRPDPAAFLLGDSLDRREGFALRQISRQPGLALCLGWIAIFIFNFVVSLVLASLPAILGYVSAALGLLYLAPLALAIYGIVNAAAGKCVPLPVIGGIKLLKPTPPPNGTLSSPSFPNFIWERLLIPRSFHFALI